MNWKLKALAQNAISRLPGSTRLNYAAQRLVMRRFGSLDRSVADRFRKAEWFVSTYRSRSATPLTLATFFEFGAGWHLAVPLSLWCLGVERQIVVDIHRHARLDLVNKAIAGLGSLPGAARRPRAVHSFAELAARYGIDYRAPSDARRTGLAPSSVDCVTSTLVMQHVPPDDLAAILRECRRILRPDGVFAAFLDYADNYAYTDRRISVYNFLRYNASAWRRLNPPLHYQNRLRHFQYRRLFADCGFEIVDETLKQPGERDLAALRNLSLAPEFAGLPLHELCILGSRVAAVLARREPAPKSYGSLLAGRP